MRQSAGCVKYGAPFAPASSSRCWMYWPTSIARQRREMITHRDALAQLAQARAVQPVAQFRLAEQDDLQQLAVVEFEVGKQPHLFEQFVGQILRLVNDQHAVPAVLRPAGAEIR